MPKIMGRNISDCEPRFWSGLRLQSGEGAVRRRQSAPLGSTVRRSLPATQALALKAEPSLTRR